MDTGNHDSAVGVSADDMPRFWWLCSADHFQRFVWDGEYFLLFGHFVSHPRGSVGMLFLAQERWFATHRSRLYHEKVELRR